MRSADKEMMWYGTSWRVSLWELVGSRVRGSIFGREAGVS